MVSMLDQTLCLLVSDPLGVVCVADVARRRRLTWYEYVERKRHEEWLFEYVER